MGKLFQLFAVSDCDDRVPLATISAPSGMTTDPDSRSIPMIRDTGFSGIPGNRAGMCSHNVFHYHDLPVRQVEKDGDGIVKDYPPDGLARYCREERHVVCPSTVEFVNG